MITGAMITAGAIILSAVTAIGISLYHSKWATKSARTKATYDNLSKKQWDKDYILARSIFIAATKLGPNGLVHQLSKEQPADKDNQEKMSVEAAARLIMNDYELTFIAVEKGVLDAELIKEFRKSTIVKDYRNTKSYVEWIRQKNSNGRIYEVFQRNAKEWSEET